MVAHQSAVQAGHPIDVLGDETDVMGHHDDGHAPVQLLQQIKDIGLDPHVDIGSGFIQDQNTRFAGKGPCHQHPLQLTAGKGRELPATQAHNLRLLHGAPGDLPIDPQITAQQPTFPQPPHQHRILHTDREVPPECRILGDITQRFSAPGGRTSKHFDPPCHRGEQPQYQF